MLQGYLDNWPNVTGTRVLEIYDQIKLIKWMQKLCESGKNGLNKNKLFSEK